MAYLRPFTDALRAATGTCQSAQSAGFSPICPGVSAQPSQPENAASSFLMHRKETTSWLTTAILAITRPITSALAGQVCSGFSLPSQGIQAALALIPSSCQPTTRLSSNSYSQSLSASGGRELAPAFAARATHPKFFEEFCQENSNFLGATLIGGTKC